MKTAESDFEKADCACIRQMTDADFGRIMQIWLDGNVSAHDFIPETYWRSQCGLVGRLIAEAEVYVCEQRGGIAGFVGLSGDYIAGIFVDEDCWSRGAGMALLDYVKTIKSGLQLHVYAKNRRAIQFYRRENFEIVKPEAPPGFRLHYLFSDSSMGDALVIGKLRKI